MKNILFLFVLLSLVGCDKEKVEKIKYPRQIGDSSFNVEKDDSSFIPCNGDNKIVQYFNYGKGLEYDGEKKALINVFKEKYVPVDVNENGLIRIRFVVNCKGDTGRFRITQTNNNYKEFSFDEKITSQLLKITQDLKGWKVKEKGEEKIDYYQYLIFKIKKGKLIEILP